MIIGARLYGGSTLSFSNNLTLNGALIFDRTDVWTPKHINFFSLATMAFKFQLFDRSIEKRAAIYGNGTIR